MADHLPTIRRHWHLDWRLLVLAGLFLPLLLALGFWQLDRAGDKEAQLERWQQQDSGLSWAELAGQAGGDDPEGTGELVEGQPVEVIGHYSQTTHWLLDNRTRDGRPGYEVLSLFRPLEGPPVVINRGWLPAPARRDTLPAIPTPDQPVTLAGRISGFPQPPVLAETTPEVVWPRRVQALSVAEARAVEPELVGRILRLAGPSQPGAFQADWQPDRMGAQTHYGYALQWFSLALALVILTVIASYRKSEPGK
ncbi:MAG: SURF1 family protein [Marinobacter sp.]|uniref:SURF1 family protein n=1 Tax=Marinobacter sp. TaxID=50741 RepID=UPI00299CEB6F|nr:SURF1 family protein [Marinobacter sp.]MDX1634153.1 SURF1 family protein [Marinobacter sp.]